MRSGIEVAQRATAGSVFEQVSIVRDEVNAPDGRAEREAAEQDAVPG